MTEVSDPMETPSREVGGKDARDPVPAVVFAADEDYALPLAAALQSLLSNLQNARDIDIYILHPYLSVPTKARLRNVVNGADSSASLSFIQVDAKKRFGHLDLRFYERFTETIYFRLLIGELLPDRHEKVLYLDCDVIVEDNVLKLWSKDMEGQVVLATQERTVSCPKFGIQRWEEMDLDPDAPYFNSGVLLIDMEKWRTLDVGQQILEYLHEHRNSLNILGNQEGFNAVLAGQWKTISQKWNLLHWYYDPDLFDQFSHGPSPKKSDLPALTEDPRIIHFSHDRKPWEPGCPHPEQGRFLHYLNQSGWFSRSKYLQWRTQFSARSFVHQLKDASRPLRQVIGL